MTDQQVLDWLSGGWKQSRFAKQLPNGFGLDVDGLYGFQCKDLSNAYADFLGHPFTAGNAIALWNVAQDSWYEKIPVGQIPRLGDVFVKDFVASDGINYGHTGVVISADASGFTSLDQNVINSSLDKGSPPAVIRHNYNQIKGYLRPQLGAEMTKEQAAELALYIRLLSFESVDQANSHSDDDVKHILADPAYAGAIAKAVYQGEWQVPAWKASNFEAELKKRDDEITSLKKQLADAQGTKPAPTPTDPNSVVITQKGWAALWETIKAFFGKNN